MDIIISMGAHEFLVAFKIY